MDNCFNITASFVLLFISIGISFYDWENTVKYSIKINLSEFSIEPKDTSLKLIFCYLEDILLEIQMN